MLEFMVIAAPRSGTTWAANWLTTDDTLCLHDPLYDHHYRDLDAIESDKMLGVACTGLFMFPEWLNDHPARKVILHRDAGEINRSLEEVGLPSLSCDLSALNRVHGMHLSWDYLFSHPDMIYEYLLQKPFDEERHALLSKFNVQPDFAKIVANKEATFRLMQEMHELGKIALDTLPKV